MLHLFLGEETYVPLGIEHVSPNSGKKTFVPAVDNALKPVVGMVFDSLQAATNFYEKYASAGGFTVRKGTDYKKKG